MLKKTFRIPLITTLFFSQLTHAQLPANYIEQNAVEKRAQLWSEVINSDYTNEELKDHVQDPGASAFLKLLNPYNLLDSFTHEGDEMPVRVGLFGGEKTREKTLHTYGSVAQVRLKINPNSPYSGLLKKNTETVGLARISLAKQAGPFTPGMALKLLVDNKPSVNLHVMNSLEGQTSKNVFEHSFSNQVPGTWDVALSVLRVSFNAAVNMLKPGSSPELLGLSHLVSVNNDGSSETTVIVPKLIIFEPTELTKKLYADSTGDVDFRARLREAFQNNTSGVTPLYKVKVKTTDEAEALDVGILLLESEFLPSEYGDKKLFFKHQI